MVLFFFGGGDIFLAMGNAGKLFFFGTQTQVASFDSEADVSDVISHRIDKTIDGVSSLDIPNASDRV